MKTFLALNLAGSVMWKEEYFIDYRIKRHGGVLFIAAEGAGSIGLRVNVMIARKLGLSPIDDDIPKQPFTWIDLQPNLLRQGATSLIKLVKKANVEMRKRFGVDIVMIFVDTAAAAAAFQDESDNRKLKR
jgi:hypothetical protein